MQILLQLPYQLVEMNLKIVSEICYFGDVIEQTGGCTDAVTTSIDLTHKQWQSFSAFSIGKSLENRSKVFKACVRTVFLYGSETWP